MKRVDSLCWRLVWVFLFICNSYAQATTYYVAPPTGTPTSPAGNDNFKGNKTAPWATWQKAISTAIAGDTVYFRGGVYYTTTAQMCYPPSNGHNGTRNNPICYFNYPGEVPILDCGKKTTPSEGLYFYDVSNIHIKGLTVRNNRQLVAGNTHATNFYFYLGNNITVENCMAYNAGMRGFYFYKTDTAFIYKCDAYNCADSISSAPGNAGDGFLVWDNGAIDDSTSHIVLRQCRSWNNSDDGYDVETEGYLELDSCIAFGNGYLAKGNGMGFKYGLKDQQTTIVTKKLTNCIGGFNTNDANILGVTQSMQIFSNISYHNNQGYIIFNSPNNTDEQELRRVYKNNIAHANTDKAVGLELNAKYTHKNNSWDSPVTLNDSDFVSLDTAQLRWPRNADGSLPCIEFGRLDLKSDLRDKGTDVGIPYEGAAPDMGAFEFGCNTTVKPPVVSDIPNQTIAEGGAFKTINLNNYVVDPDNTDDQIIWTSSGSSQIKVTINQTTKVATIAANNAEWNGAETITFKAIDPDSLFDTDRATFTVTAVNDGPVVSDIPNQTTTKGGAFAAINLNNYVADVDNMDDQITWTCSGNSELTVTIDEATGIATITPKNSDWSGSETVTFMATDLGGLYNSDMAMFTISTVNFPPIISKIPDQVINDGNVFGSIMLDNYVADQNYADDQIIWTILGNSQLSVDIDPSTRVARIIATNASWIGTETLTFTATNPGGLLTTTQSSFSITMANHAPEFADQQFSVNESGFSDNFIGRIVSSDPDAGQQLTYSILSGNDAGVFTLNSQTGDLKTTTDKVFGSGIASFELWVVVTDNAPDAKSASAHIVVNLIGNSNNVYIDPTNTGDLLANGSIEHPHDSWNKVVWKKGNRYLQKRGTTASVEKILIGASNVSLGDYGEGELPVIKSETNSYLISSFEKSGIKIRNLNLQATNAVSCVYFLGNSGDSITVEHCELTANTNAVKVVDGIALVVKYNTIKSNAEGIHTTAISNEIYYNIFKSCNTAVNVLGNSSKANIYNNVFYDNEKSLSISYAELTLYNNIFYMTNPGQMAISHGTGLISSDYNIFYPEQSGFITIAKTSFDKLEKMQKALRIDLNSFNKDPLFVDVYSENFFLEAGSPAIDAGINLMPGLDIAGRQVPLSKSTDIGVNEFPGSTMPAKLSNEGSVMTIYPNPSSGQINIFAEIKQDMLTDDPDFRQPEIQVLDIAGNTVFYKRIENQYTSTIRDIIDLSEISNGLYFVILRMADKVIKEKLILNK
jgi:hypothetical protein